ncbi:hypothetical protein C8Q72DRAFT_57906 [Fomitopsis betulina]|nr:hypothetical protein C8Q72DRAFT_57906 [Fomitopsis betulina]
MTGPPTPPPTTEAEIQDAARTSIPPQVTPMATDPEPPITVDQPSDVQQTASTSAAPTELQGTPFEILLSTLADLADVGQYRELVLAAEQGDALAQNDRHQTRMFVVAPLVLSYLVLDDIAAARHALTRVPDSFHKLPVWTSLFSLLKSVHLRQHETVYTGAEELFNLCHQPALSNGKLGVVLAGLTTAFVEEFRRKTFVLLGKAYTSISVPLAQRYLGLPIDQILFVASSNGWAYDATTQVLTPPRATRSRVVLTDPSNLSTLSSVVDSISRA